MTRLVLPGMVERYYHKHPYVKGWYEVMNEWIYRCLSSIYCTEGKGWSSILPLKWAPDRSLCWPYILPLRYFLIQKLLCAQSHLNTLWPDYTHIFTDQRTISWHCFMTALLVLWLCFSSSFQSFVINFSRSLHAEYKSEGIIVQVKYVTLRTFTYSSWRKCIKLLNHFIKWTFRSLVATPHF